MQLRNFIRRQKWRLRPLKRLVLPVRNAKRLAVRILRKVPTIEQSARNYRGPSFRDVTEVYPSAKITALPHPLRPNEPIVDLTSEPALVYHFTNIDFWARYGGSLVTEDNCLLADLSPEVWGVENHPLFSRLRLPALRDLPGRTAIAVTPEAPGNYYHWLIDLLPRIDLLQFGQRDFDRVLINGARTDYEKASLAALKIPREKIVYVSPGNRFQIEDATVGSMDHSAKAIAPWKIEMLRRLRDSLPPTQTDPRKLYISRKRAAVRRVSNEPAFEQTLRAANFSIVELESKPWEEQVRLFSQAEVVLAPHGAALANIVFCEPGALVAEIGTRAGYKDFYLQLAASAGLRYCFIPAQARATGRADSFRATENEDMIVDLDAIREFLTGV